MEIDEVVSDVCRVPVAMRSEGWVLAACLLGLLVLILLGAWMDICALWVLFVVRLSLLWQSDPSSREVLLSVYVSLSVVKCNNNPLHLSRKRSENKKERKKKERKFRFVWAYQVGGNTVFTALVPFTVEAVGYFSAELCTVWQPVQAFFKWRNGATVRSWPLVSV